MRKRFVRWGDRWIDLDAIKKAKPYTSRSLLRPIVTALSKLEGFTPSRMLEIVHNETRDILDALYPGYFEEEKALLDSFRAKSKRPIPHGLRMRVFERDGFRCLRCGVQKDLTADHVIPESAGGPTTLENLQTLCRPCNCKKGKKLPA